MTEALPFQTQQPIFGKMGGISELSHMNTEERRKYFNSLNKYRTSLSVMQNEREEGRAEGYEEGRADRDQEIVLRLSSKGMKSEEIVDLIGLDINQINQIIGQ